MRRLLYLTRGDFFQPPLDVAKRISTAWRFLWLCCWCGGLWWMSRGLWDPHSSIFSIFKHSYLLHLISNHCIFYMNFDHLAVLYAVMQSVHRSEAVCEIHFSQGLLCNFASWTSLFRNSSPWTLNRVCRLSYFLVSAWWPQWYSQFPHRNSPSKSRF